MFFYTCWFIILVACWAHGERRPHHSLCCWYYRQYGRTDQWYEHDSNPPFSLLARKYPTGEA